MKPGVTGVRHPGRSGMSPRLHQWPTSTHHPRPTEVPIVRLRCGRAGLQEANEPGGLDLGTVQCLAL